MNEMCKCGHRKEIHFFATNSENNHCLAFSCKCTKFDEECKDNRKDSIGE